MMSNLLSYVIKTFKFKADWREKTGSDPGAFPDFFSKGDFYDFGHDSGDFPETFSEI